MLNWHPATVSRRGQKYYVVLTVPKEARKAVGANQLRRSTGTADKREAERRRWDLERELRQEVMKKVQAHALSDHSSAFQRAVSGLGLSNTVYSGEFQYIDGDYYEPVPRTMSKPPRDPHEARLAMDELERVSIEKRAARLGSNISEDKIRFFRRFPDHVPPTSEEVEKLVFDAKQELSNLFDDGPKPETLSSHLIAFEVSLERRVAKGTIKERSKKARIKHIRQFQRMIGDLHLAALESKHAYDFAKKLEEQGLSRSTIQTRISDVSTMLDEAVEEGRLKTNPFKGLRLSKFGTKGKNYTPFDDNLLSHLFSIPKLPKDVRDMWAVLVGTGMRLDEVALCEARQIRAKDGIQYVDLRNALVKNENSRREVPICATLEPLIRARIAGKQPGQRLFDFPIKESGKSRASEQCGYWMKKIDFNKLAEKPNARFTNHSLRGTFKDKLRDAEVGLEINNAILGHDQNTVSASYGRGPSLQAKKDAVDRPKHGYLDWIKTECSPQI